MGFERRTVVERSSERKPPVDPEIRASGATVERSYVASGDITETGWRG
jgi:hypothetical protein